MSRQWTCEYCGLRGHNAAGCHLALEARRDHDEADLLAFALDARMVRSAGIAAIRSLVAERVRVMLRARRGGGGG